MAAPVLALGLQAGTAVAGGIASSNAAKGEKLQAQINTYVARTRAMQTNASARHNLEGELSTIRSTLGANGQRPTSATFNMMQEVRNIRNSERLLNVSGENRKAMDYQIAGKNAGARATGAMIGGVGNAASSIFDLAQLI